MLPLITVVLAFLANSTLAAPPTKPLPYSPSLGSQFQENQERTGLLGCAGSISFVKASADYSFDLLLSTQVSKDSASAREAAVRRRAQNKEIEHERAFSITSSSIPSRTS
ncbi:hypothetical protein COCVIDRAFT_20617 [Bipolaris victoriae FI3]|uniref:Uncharacterized protein n=1 Tax=Bipolaris victoriae (strain FI3) TaxID=930091 RepID=W7E335_BIPV3|nr:hypothetical protein COCVIDRAFT_20617 [Bipolaris victoriae FI3]